MTIDGMIAVLQAAKEGKSIQFKNHLSNGWTTCGTTMPCWNFDSNEYRVKPEPREFTLNIYNNGYIDNSPRPPAWNGEVKHTIKVREILE